MTYTIDKDGKSITCHECGMTSYNKTDVEQRYCGRCHMFHDLLPGEARPTMGEVSVEKVTPALRWVVRELPTMHHRSVRESVLQQAYEITVLEDGKPVRQYVEWRDVETVSG